MNQLRAGGRAIVINAVVKENIGREVRLVKNVSVDILLTNRGCYIKSMIQGSRDNWIVEADLLVQMTIDGESYITRTTEALFPAVCLMPIGDDPDVQTEQTKTKIAEPA